jgi:hypothetical protein
MLLSMEGSIRMKKINKNKMAVNAHIYEQDCEFYRYQDSNKWSIFKTISTIEGGILYIFFNEITIFVDKIVILISGMILVSILSLLPLRDADRKRRYLDRIKDYEKDTFPKGDKFFKWVSRNYLIITAFIISSVNCWLIYSHVICK